MTDKAPMHQSVLQKLKHDSVIPTPAWHFVVRDCGTVALFVLSVLLGAVAVAVSLFVFSYQRYALFEASHETWVSLLIETLPFLWIGALAVCLLLAARHQRHFRCGYRYSLSVLLGSSAVVSVLLGVLLHQANVGFMVDNILGEKMPMYGSQAKLEHGLWQKPEEGRLVGMQVYTTLATTSTIIFEDSMGRRWQADISELMVDDVDLLATGAKVRLLGVLKNELVYSFHACGVFPWMADSPMTGEQLKTERDVFVAKVYRHDTSPQKRQILIENVLTERPSSTPSSICSGLAAINRMHNTMK